MSSDRSGARAAAGRPFPARAGAQSALPRQGDARYAWYVATVLAAANALSFVDRQVLALLIQPIKLDLGASDTMMSLLHGFSFALLYAVAGLPIARVADSYNRRNLIGAAIVTWSVMTALCGAARGYWTLFAARVGVGAGEGGLTPSAQSMLADYFPKERLPAALGLYSIGIYVGGGLALIAGGWLVQLVATLPGVALPGLGMFSGWRLVFLVLGGVGVLFVLVFMTVREPERRDSSRSASSHSRGVPVSAVWAHVRAQRWAYLGIFGGFCVMIMAGSGTNAWIPTFFIRRFGWSVAEVGRYYGLAVLVCGTAGALCGGFFASALRRRGHVDANLRASLLGFVLLVPFAVSYPLAPDERVALVLVGGYNFFAGFPFGGGYAAIQEITPARMRAQVLACFLFLVNLVGQGFGPTLVALFTDYLFMDEQQLPSSLALTALVTAPLGIILLLLGRRHYGAALQTKG